MPKITDYLPVKVKQFKPDGSRWPDLFGVELELEQIDEPKHIPYWTIKEDNSLRNGLEYVLDCPYAGASLESAVDEFYSAKLKYKNTARTSTHIHVNISDCEFDVVRSMALVMYTIEDALFNVVGEARKWSGYACSLNEMDPQRMRRVFLDDKESIMHAFNPGRNQERYYGFNFSSVARHGTVEFRYFPGGPSREELESWIDLVYYVKKTGLEVTPMQIVENIHSPGDLYHFLVGRVGKMWADKLVNASNLEAMFAKFTEVAAYVTDADAPERREPLVFINDAIMGFLNKKILSEAGMDYITKIRAEFGTVTQGEWLYHVNEAMALSGKQVKKPKNKGVKFEAPQEYGRFEDQEWRTARRIEDDMPATGNIPNHPIRLEGNQWEPNAWQNIPDPDVNPARAAQLRIADAEVQRQAVELRRQIQLQRLRDIEAERPHNLDEEEPF